MSIDVDELVKENGGVLDRHLAAAYAAIFDIPHSISVKSLREVIKQLNRLADEYRSKGEEPPAGMLERKEQLEAYLALIKATGRGTAQGGAAGGKR